MDQQSSSKPAKLKNDDVEKRMAARSTTAEERLIVAEG